MARQKFYYEVDGVERSIQDLIKETGLQQGSIYGRFLSPKFPTWKRFILQDKWDANKSRLIRVKTETTDMKLRKCKNCEVEYQEGVGGGRMLCNRCYRSASDDGPAFDDVIFPIHLP